MTKNKNKKEPPTGHDAYKQALRDLQVELVKVQRHLIAHDHRVLIIFEGRDASGKDGVIKRIVEHLSPRETRVVALGKPSDHDRRSWYFQRFTPHLPANQELALFNRSWYNRAGVERVMGFCTEGELNAFITDVVPFEEMLINSGAQILKYYLDIDRKEQARRLEDRRVNPLKQWKISPIDDVAVEKWDAYTEARNDMLVRTSFDEAPWHVVRTNNKKAARLNVIRHILSKLDCPDKDVHMARPDEDVIFAFSKDRLIDLAA
ncbi:polyphosphate kinase 2 [Marinicaulis aureus]|uniref:ADP/GDP-polyphosphate phosphotransferase n=1 Tax=Hyphococcus aureus TaxID=2666033 RepID=A0ABW1KZR5_9PROT|nr:polyphosphate kinase 2 [Parvularcula sp.]